MATVTDLEAIRQALWDEMEQAPQVFMLGQDIGTYGGAFRVTAGFRRVMGWCRSARRGWRARGATSR
jgi:2-oxoisovalerate dehydrogenase E1 component beta subunit